jgi:cyclophilin family peptidyl-prolyl cis-trans isomerase
MPISVRLTISFLFAFSLFASQACANDASQSTKILLETSKGNIELQLYPELAPATVANFLRYVDEGFYNGTIFHRVINSFMIQGGGFDTDMKKKDVHESIQNEADNRLKNERGTIAMARTGEPHSATAQFFINHADNDFLNHTNRSQRGWGYCVFGKVTNGMKTVDAIADVFTTQVHGMKNVPEENVIITKASRI